MKFSMMTLTATVAAMAMASEMALAGPTLRLLPKITAIGSVSAQNPLRLGIRSEGVVQVSVGNLGLQRRLRVIGPSGRTLAVSGVGAQQKFSFKADRAGIYRINLGLATPQPIPGGTSGLDNASPDRRCCWIVGESAAHKASVSLQFTASGAGSVSGTDLNPVTGGDDTFGGNINPGGSPHHAGLRKKRGQLGPRQL